MELYKFVDPLEPLFRTFRVTQAFFDSIDSCPKCDETLRALQPPAPPPVPVETVRKGKALGDFSTAGIGSVTLLTKEAADRLGRFKGVDLGPVVLDGEPTDELVELLPGRVVEADPVRSTYGISEEPCQECGVHVWGMIGRHEETGVGYRHHGIDFEKRQGYVTHWDRRKDHGLYVSKKLIRGVDVFRFPQMPWIICTARFRDFVVTSGFTNYDFQPIGATF